jgi:beta-phosphoglucomutase
MAGDALRGCVLFDFDGVIADTEKLHLDAYNRAFAAHAADIGGPLVISEERYFSAYIVFGNHEGITKMLTDAGRPTEPQLIARLCEAKDAAFAARLHEFSNPLPGVRQVLAWLESHGVPRAICSGAAKHEIVDLLAAFDLTRHFEIIVSIEDVTVGKPNPEGYRKAFDLLNAHHGGVLSKEKSFVIEDSAGGCKAGKAAGLRVVGVATSLPLEKVACYADEAVATLEALDGVRLGRLLGI